MKYSVVAYIPAIHKGYLDFLKQYPGSLYIIGSEFLKTVPRLERDIRALEPEEIKKLLDGDKRYTTSIDIISEENIKKLQDDPNQIIMPDEEVSHQFAEEYLKGHKIKFVSVFLRWDRQISTTEFQVPPDRILSHDDFDREIMTEAFKESTKSPDWWRQIGAIIIKDKKALLIGHNKALPSEQTLNAFGDPRSNFDAGEAQYKELGKFIHGEANLIAQAAKMGIALEGTSLYVTTFPCPACAKSIAVAGIKEVFYTKGYSMLDAEDILKAFGIKITLVKTD